MSKAVQQDWQHGGIEAVRQMEEINKQLDPDYVMKTEQEMQAIADARANDKMWDVELDDGKTISVKATSEQDAITKAEEHYQHLADLKANPPKTEVEELKDQVATLTQALVDKGTIAAEDVAEKN